MQPNFKPEFSKSLFPDYIGILIPSPTNSKKFNDKIVCDQNSRRVSSHINADMGDVWNIHDLRLMYSTYATNGRCTEHSHFMVDVQDLSALRKMVRTSRTDKAQTINYLSAIGINFLLLLLQPSGKLRKL